MHKHVENKLEQVNALHKHEAELLCYECVQFTQNIILKKYTEL